MPGAVRARQGPRTGCGRQPRCPGPSNRWSPDDCRTGRRIRRTAASRTMAGRCPAAPPTARRSRPRRQTTMARVNSASAGIVPVASILTRSSGPGQAAFRYTGNPGGSPSARNSSSATRSRDVSCQQWSGGRNASCISSALSATTTQASTLAHDSLTPRKAACERFAEPTSKSTRRSGVAGAGSVTRSAGRSRCRSRRCGRRRSPGRSASCPRRAGRGW
jgi:hypothetical protein